MPLFFLIIINCHNCLNNRGAYILVKKIAIILFMIFSLQGCSDKKNEIVKNNDLLNNVLLSDNLFVSQKQAVPENINIKGVDFFNDDLYCLAADKNESSDLKHVILNSEGLVKSEYNIINNYGSFIDIIHDSESNIYYILWKDLNDKFIFSKYNIIANHEEENTILNNISDFDSAWIKDDYIYLAYHSEDKLMINIYNKNLELIESKIVPTMCEDDYIYDIYPLTYDTYGCYIYSDKNYISILDAEFNILETSDITWEEYYFRYTVNQNNNLQVFEKTDDSSGYCLYEISGENAQTQLVTDIELENIVNVFNGYNEYDFLYSLYDGLYGYNINTSNSSKIYNTENYIVNVTINNNKIEITEKINEKPLHLEKLKENIIIKEFDCENFEDIYMGDQGDYYYLRLEAETGRFYIEKYSSDYKLKDEIELGDSNECLRSLCVNNGYICALIENFAQESFSIRYFDAISGNKENEIYLKDLNPEANQSPYDIFYNKKNTYLALHNRLFVIDENNIISEPQFPLSNNDYSFIDFNADYEVCINSIDGIYGLKDDKWIQILKWENCDVDFSQKNYIFVKSDSLVYVIGSISSNGQLQLFEFCKDTKESISKKIIRISGVNMGVEFCDFEERTQFFDYIRNINNTSNDIQFVFNDYKDVESMQLDIVSGNNPDIIFMTDEFEFDNDLLLDLTDYFDENKSISDKNYYTNLFSLEYNDKITEVPVTYAVHFMIGKESEVGDISDLTKKQYINLLRKGQKNNSVYGEDLLTAANMVLGLNLNNYIDFDKKDCFVNTNENCDLLNELKKSFSSEGTDESQDVITRFTDNLCPIDFCTMAIPEECAYWSEYLIGEDPALHGIPSNTGSSPIISTAYSLGIMADSSNADECLNLVFKLLSDDYQDSVTFLPVKKSSLKKRLKNSGVKSKLSKQIDEMISKASVKAFSNSKITEIFNEEMLQFIEDEKNASESLKTIEDKIDIYLNERY